MKEAIVVLGMHRSGTSSLAGAIAKLGAVAPRTLMPDHPDNPKGYWESEVLVNLSDRILTSGGSSWSDWRPFNPDWSQSPDGIALTKTLSPAIKKEFGGAPLIVFKDPRMCRIFPVWAAALKSAGYQARVLTPLRSPIEVAASLHSRDGFTVAHGMMIWLRNVLDAELASRDTPRRFVLWRDVLTDWRVHLIEALNGIGVTAPRRSDLADAEVDDFLDTRLRRQAREILSTTPVWVGQTWSALQQLQASPMAIEAMATLDAVRAEFDDATRIFGPVLVGLEQDASDLLATRRELDTLRPEQVRLFHELAGMTANRNDHAGLAHTRLEALTATEARLEEARVALGLAKAELHASGEARRAVEERLSHELAGMTANRDDHARLAAARHVALETATLQVTDLLDRLNHSEIARDRLELTIAARDAALAECISANAARLEDAARALRGMTANRDEHQSIAAERQILIDEAAREITRLEQALGEEAEHSRVLAETLDQAAAREAHLTEQAAGAARLLNAREAAEAAFSQERETIELERDSLARELTDLRRRQREQPLKASLTLIRQAWRMGR